MRRDFLKSLCYLLLLLLELVFQILDLLLILSLVCIDLIHRFSFLSINLDLKRLHIFLGWYFNYSKLLFHSTKFTLHRFDLLIFGIYLNLQFLDFLTEWSDHFIFSFGLSDSSQQICFDLVKTRP